MENTYQEQQMEAVKNNPLKFSERLLLSKLHEDSSMLIMSNKSMAKFLNMSTPTISKSINKLAECKFIEVEFKFSGGRVLGRTIKIL